MTSTNAANPIVSDIEQLAIEVTWGGDKITISFLMVNGVTLSTDEQISEPSATRLFQAHRGVGLHVQGEIISRLGKAANVKVTVVNKSRSVSPLDIATDGGMTGGDRLPFDKLVSFGPP